MQIKLVEKKNKKLTLNINNTNYELNFDSFATICYFAKAIRIILGKLSENISQLETFLDQKIDTIIFFFDKLPSSTDRRVDSLGMFMILKAVLEILYKIDTIDGQSLPINRKLKVEILPIEKEQKEFILMNFIDWIVEMEEIVILK